MLRPGLAVPKGSLPVLEWPPDVVALTAQDSQVDPRLIQKASFLCQGKCKVSLRYLGPLLWHNGRILAGVAAFLGGGSHGHSGGRLTCQMLFSLVHARNVP